MSIAQNIFKLMGERNITAYKLSKELEISNGNFTDWKKGRVAPSQKAIEKIANYFDVSVDYLIGNEATQKKPTTVPDDGLSAERRLVIERISELDDSQIAALTAILDSILKLREK